MKKLIQSTIALTAFAVSILFVDISCKKNLDAAPLTQAIAATQQNKIIYQKEILSGGTNGKLYSYAEIWSANYDGTGQQKINIDLPTDIVVAIEQVRLSPDGQTIFFTGFNSLNINVSFDYPVLNIYSCNIDGSNVKLLVAGNADDGVKVNVAY